MKNHNIGVAQKTFQFSKTHKNRRGFGPEVKWYFKRKIMALEDFEKAKQKLYLKRKLAQKTTQYFKDLFIF